MVGVASYSVLVVNRYRTGVQMRPNQSPKPTLESIAALCGSVSGSAAWLKR